MRQHILGQGKAMAETLAANREKIEAFRFTGFKHLLLSGAGDKFATPLMCLPFYRQFAEVPAEVIHARNLANYPPHYLGPDTLVIFLTQSGKTRDVLDAVEVCIQRNTKLVAITNLKPDLVEKPGIWHIEDHNGIVLNTYTTIYPEKPTPSTQTFFTSALLLYMCLAQLVKYDISSELDRLCLLVEELSASSEEKWKKQAKAFSRRMPAYFMGDGPRFGAAYKAAMIMAMEAMKEDAAAVHTEEFLHSLVETLEKDNRKKQLLVLFMPPQGAPMRAHAEKILETWKSHAPVMALEPVKVSSDPVLNDLLGPMLQIIPVEWLTYWGAIFKGTDPGKTDIVKKVRTGGF